MIRFLVKLADREKRLESLHELGGICRGSLIDAKNISYNKSQGYLKIPFFLNLLILGRRFERGILKSMKLHGNFEEDSKYGVEADLVFNNVKRYEIKTSRYADGIPDKPYSFSNFELSRSLNKFIIYDEEWSEAGLYNIEVYFDKELNVILNVLGFKSVDENLKRIIKIISEEVN